MAYSRFTLQDVLRQFNLTLHEGVELFRHVPAVSPSNILSLTLEESVSLALSINSEKARSELIIMPILMEMRRHSSPISLFSGVNFDVDIEQGLNGYCDYLLTRSSQQLFIESPVFAVVEAKNEDIKSGLGQCIAEMVGAQVFNERANTRQPTVYGAVTTGTNWRFLKLEGQNVSVDKDEEFWTPLEHLLGILTTIVYPGTGVDVA